MPFVPAPLKASCAKADFKPCRMREKSAAAEIACLVLSRGVSQGGKSRRHGKPRDDENRELVFHEVGKEYAKVIKDARTWTLRDGPVLQRREVEATRAYCI